MDNLSIIRNDEVISFKSPFNNGDTTNPLDYLKKNTFYFATAYSSNVTGSGIFAPAYSDAWRCTITHSTDAKTLNLSWDKNGFRAWGNTTSITSISIFKIKI